MIFLIMPGIPMKPKKPIQAMPASM